MLENVSLALQGVWSHKLRSFLTMLGIIIGIAAIITIVSTIKGTNEQIKQNLIGQGTNVVTVQLTQDGYEYDMSWSAPPQGVTPLTEERRAELEKLDGVEEVSLYYQRQWSDNVYYGNTSYSGAVYGVDSHYFSVNDYTVNYGRGFVPSDFTQRRKVALVDSSTARSLFTGENPVGRTIEMQGEPFTVVGVVSRNSGSCPVIDLLKLFKDKIPVVCSGLFQIDEILFQFLLIAQINRKAPAHGFPVTGTVVPVIQVFCFFIFLQKGKRPAVRQPMMETMPVYCLTGIIEPEILLLDDLCQKFRDLPVCHIQAEAEKEDRTSLHTVTVQPSLNDIDLSGFYRRERIRRTVQRKVQRTRTERTVVEVKAVYAPD